MKNIPLCAKLISHSFGFFAVILLCAIADSGVDEHARVVATVYGQPIQYDQIHVEPSEVKETLGEDVTPAVLAEACQKQEVSNLANVIRHRVMEHVLKTTPVDVSDAEVEAYLDDRFKRAGYDEKEAERIRRIFLKLCTALEKWQETPEQDRDIYKRFLADTDISPKAWEAYKKSFNTPEKLEKAREMIPSGLADIKAQSIESARNDLILEALEKDAIRGVSVSAEEVEAEYNEGYKGVLPFEEVKDDLAKTIMARKEAEAITKWWSERYKDANIKILDAKCSGVIALLPGLALRDSEGKVIENANAAIGTLGQNQ